MIFSGSAPGSLMLFGEHAVLHGKQALCCAVDQRICVTVTPRQDQEIHLSSPRLGMDVIDLNAFAIRAPFTFVLTAIDQYRPQIQRGFDLTVNADFCATMGLGSSSAVTVATVGTLAQWLGRALSPQELFNESKAVVLRVQGVASGADVAAAVLGGVVAYRAQPLEMKSFEMTPDLVLVYSGKKVPTQAVIQIVSEKQKAEPTRYHELYNKIEACVEQAILALQEKNWKAVGELMNQHQLLQTALGVSTPLLDELVSDLCRQPQIYGAKISGSGLGDCVVGLGLAAHPLFPLTEQQQRVGVTEVPVKISAIGYQNEKN